MSRFTKVWYTALACLTLVACSAFILGSRDTNYVGDRTLQAPINVEQAEWWGATIMLRTNAGKQWCSAVAVNNTASHIFESGIITNPDGSKTSSMRMEPATFLVTARHCATNKLRGGTAYEILYAPDGSVIKEIKHEILEIYSHPTKDFTVLKITGHTIAMTPVYKEPLPFERQDFIIGFRGDSHGDHHKYGKHISPAYAYKGQSGGGVFSPGIGLHAIVSTHTDGVNIWTALVDMQIDHVVLQ